MSKIDNRANIVTRMEGTKLVLEIETDLDKVDAQPSASGKTLTIATTGGYQWNVGRVGLGINVTVSQRR